ncbi:MAG: phosphoribosylaminoimidazolesuccinocarboxamide synthase [Actinomycetota bacterium]|nr:phosphoribosylaminoimidazolesuccinocarboxamide synthase [Actinomycetota bacterium]
MSTAPTSQGKVRDIYDLGDRLLLVATDRISAYDVVLPGLIPDKGRVLTAMSLFWFARTQGLTANHLISAKTKDFPDIGLDKDYLAGRTLLVKKAEVIPIECVVRGYLSGSAWADYKATGAVSGQRQNKGMKESQMLPEPLFTPSTKAVEGHDENITVARMENIVGADLTRRLRQISLNLYCFAAAFAAGRGIIIADTKFEFGKVGDNVILIDEVLTPDSSRFWPVDGYEIGKSQPSFDKQFVRDWLDDSGWDRQPPGPELPPEIIRRTRRKYVEAYERLTGAKWPAAVD